MKSDAQRDSAVAARVHNAQATLQDAGDKMVAGVQPLIDAKQYVQAVATLEDVERAFLGSPSGDKAKTKLDELSKDPACKAAIDAAKRQAAADSALADAQQLRTQKKDFDAYQRFKFIVTNFPGTAAADSAAGAVSAYESDPGFAQCAKDAAAADKSKSLFNLADAYHKSGRDDLARAKLQSVIDSFPGTTYAQQAQQQIDAINAGQ